MLRFSLILIGVIQLLPGARAAAYCRMTVEEPRPRDRCPAPGTFLEWERRCISYTLVERDQAEPDLEELRDATQRSFSRWTDADCGGGRGIGLDLAQTSDLGACTTPEYNQRSGNTNTIFFVSDWIEQGLPFDAFGLTMIWHSPEDGEIFDADMQLNETQGRFTVCGNSCEPGTVDLENVITHEAGHFLGLGHSTDDTATMHSRASLGEVSKRELGDDDVEGICDLYGDLDAPDCSVGDFQPDNGFTPECEGPDENLAPRSSGGLCSVTPPHSAPHGRRGRGSVVVLALICVCFCLRRQRSIR